MQGDTVVEAGWMAVPRNLVARPYKAQKKPKGGLFKPEKRDVTSPLPYEVLACIFKALPRPYEWLSCRLVCSRWATLVADGEEQWWWQEVARRPVLKEWLVTKPETMSCKEWCKSLVTLQAFFGEYEWHSAPMNDGCCFDSQSLSVAKLAHPIYSYADSPLPIEISRKRNHSSHNLPSHDPQGKSPANCESMSIETMMHFLRPPTTRSGLEAALRRGSRWYGRFVFVMSTSSAYSDHRETMEGICSFDMKSGTLHFKGALKHGTSGSKKPHGYPKLKTKNMGEQLMTATCSGRLDKQGYCQSAYDFKKHEGSVVITLALQGNGYVLARNPSPTVCI